jgi:hypothetical protein
MGTERRAPKGLFVVPEFSQIVVPALLLPAVSALFGYLRHRAYLKTAQQICDRHGPDALRVFLSSSAVRGQTKLPRGSR